MNTAPVDDVLRTLRSVRRRLFTQAMMNAIARALLIAGAGLVVAGVVRRLVLQLPPWEPRLGLAALALAALVALAMAIARRVSLVQAATVIDTLGQTRDRFLTALEFSRGERRDGWHERAVRECTTFVRGGDFPRLVRFRMPRELPYLIVPVVAVALLSWEARSTFGLRDAEAAAARAEIEETARKLEELARQSERAHEQTKAEDWKKLAEEMKRSARDLRADARTSEEAEKARLRELSQLEQLLQEMQKQNGAPTPAEWRELAKALEKKEETKETADALEKGDLARAAESLEKALKDLEEAGDERTREEIDQALKQAMERLAEQKQMSEAMQKLAKQMQQQGEQGKGGQQISKELADMLRKMQPQPGQPGQGKPLDEQSLKNLLAALQNLKFGEGPPGQPQSGEGKPQGLVFMEGGDPKPGEGGDPRIPSGKPGSEKDTGTTDNPFGKESGPAADKGAQQSLAGRLGEGETLQQFLPGVADASKSKRRYKELYEAMAPAAEDAVVQENIPLGSRFFIKRYFESIRPKE